AFDADRPALPGDLGERRLLHRPESVCAMGYAGRMNDPQAAAPEGREEMPQATRLDDVRIREVRPLISPALLQYELPADAAGQAFVERSRGEVAAAVHGQDPRLLAIVGPCSIHDHAQALEYAQRLRAPP